MNESRCKLNKIWVDKGSEFYKNQYNDISYIWSIQWYRYAFNKLLRKICCCWRFIRTLNNKILEDMASVSKNMCIDKLADTDKEYNNTTIQQSK